MRPVALLLAAALLWAPGHTLIAQGSARKAPGSARIVAIGDIHGSIEGFTAILKAAGLTDASGRWSGGRTQLIQTGDYTDRGAGTRAVLDLLMALESQAKSAGGRAFAVLGNHEVMNLIGDTRDVTLEIFATFADANSEKKREAAWEDYAKLAAARVARGEAVPPVYGQTRDAWLAAHPPGYVEYREAFAPRGKYGAWLRNKPIVTEAGGSIFMHAGIAPENAPVKLEDLNVKVRDEIARLDKFVDRAIKAKLATPTFTLQEIMQVAQNELTIANAIFAAAKAEGKEPDRGKLNVALLMEAQELMNIETWAVVAPDGPLWYRGLATMPDDPAGGPIAALLAKYGAKRFVTGHTPQQSRSITPRFGGRAVLIDTGMLTSVYKGRASALEIDGDTLTAIYEDGRVPLEVRYQATVSRSPSSSPTVGR